MIQIYNRLDINLHAIEKDFCNGAEGLYSPVIVLLTFVLIIGIVGDLASRIHEMVFGLFRITAKQLDCQDLDGVIATPG